MKRKMWPLVEQALFFTRLGRLLERGYPLGQALEFLAIQAPTHRRLEIERCLQQLRAGLPLFAAVEALSVDRMAVNLLFLPNGMATCRAAWQRQGKRWRKKRASTSSFAASAAIRCSFFLCSSSCSS